MSHLLQICRRVNPLSTPWRAGALAALVAVLVAVPPLVGWTEFAFRLELAILSSGAMLAAGHRLQQVSALHRGIMPPSFLFIVAAFLLFGRHVATLVAAATALAPLTRSWPPRGWLPHVLNVAVLSISAQLAGFAAETSAPALNPLLAPGTPGFEYAAWPVRAVPIALATIVYVALQRALAARVVPLITREAPDSAWPGNGLDGLPAFLIGAAMAAGVLEVAAAGMWGVLPIAAVAVFCAGRLYADYVQRLEDERRVQQVSTFVEQGMAVVDRDGRVTFWSDALERLVGRTRDRALGCRMEEVVLPASRTALKEAVEGTLSDGEPRVLPQVNVPGSATASGPSRAMHVKVVPVTEGAALLWQDVTERFQAERELKRSGERLELAAEGANDGLWQWNFRTQEFYVSGRWRAMVGLPAESRTGAASQWMERVHPDDLPGLNEALRAHLAGETEVLEYEHRLRHEDGTYRRFLCRAVAVGGRGPRRERIAGSLTDTTEQALAKERLRSVGFVDSLTGLYNRAIFAEGLGRRLAEAKHRGSNAFAVLYLDLDRFKIVNDSLGHLVGDELLVAVSRRLESCLRHGDALARLGGDEFAVLLSGLIDDGQANGIAFRIQDALSAPFSIGGREVFTSASIGIAFGPAHYTDPDELMRDADTAMYHAKSRGKARHEVFDEAMHARVRDRLSLENDLRRAITSNQFEREFEVVYQPIVLLATGMCVGFESLIRWTRNGEPVSPATFVPIAEELGLIEPLGTWVMQQACFTFADWQRRFPDAGLDCITVNVSSRQLVAHNFPRVMQNVVHNAGLEPANVRVEITETALLDNPGEAADVLRELRQYGLKVYLDDFGTGYSSLSHLHKLPVDALKIDRSFVNSLLLPDRPAIVESILALARTLNTSVVAEGIEEAVQARELERLGCTHAQGFLFSRPLSLAKAEAVISGRKPLGPKGSPEVDAVGAFARSA